MAPSPKRTVSLSGRSSCCCSASGFLAAYKIEICRQKFVVLSQPPLLFQHSVTVVPKSWRHVVVFLIDHPSEEGRWS